MSEPGLLIVLIVLGSSIGAALLAVAYLQWATTRSQRFASASQGWVETAAPSVYEFREGYLVSDCEDRDVFLADPKDRSGAWSALSDVLARVNPQVRSGMEELQRVGRSFALTGQVGQDGLAITGSVDGDLVRISVTRSDGEAGALVLDADTHRRQRAAAEELRKVTDIMPMVAWLEGPDGQIVWANAGYFELLEQLQVEADVPKWPPRQLFGEDLRPLPEPGQTRRCGLSVAERSEPLWFEIRAEALGSKTLLTAAPADRLVAAEDALREFVQTLSKTFADLPIGLAIFDRRRELVLFNPALVSLSTLDAQFLSGRPTLFTFLDQLREKRQMPEPKNYKAWRESIAKLEADAEEGTYHDLWTLPMGQTYRVIGRPHPGGAIAFMFEDISSEVSLTRQFRADLDLYQAAIDQNAAAIAVFSASGQLVMSNTAYAELWGHDPRELLGVLSLTEATQRWQSATVPAPLWGEIREFAGQRQDRVIWTDTLTTRDQRDLFVQVSPLKGGATMLSFEMLAERAGVAAHGDDAAATSATTTHRV